MLKKTAEAFETIEVLKRNWDNPTTPIVLVLFLLTGGLTLAYSFDLLGLPKEISLEELCAIGLSAFCIPLFWYWTSKPRKTIKGKIGIIVAIDCESLKERLRLKADFVTALRDEISRGSQSHFDVLELSEYHSQRSQTKESALRYLRIARAHLIIFGRCRIRQHRSQKTYVLELHEAVSHVPIPSEVSVRLSNDMRLALPNKLLIPEINELEGFEISKDMVGIAARFALGLASLVSADPVTAFDLHQSAWRDWTSKILIDESTPNVFKALRSRMATFLVTSGLQAAKLFYDNKPEGYLDKVNSYLDVVQEIDPNNYDAHLARAACVFLRDRDIGKAKEEIRKARNERNAAWQYSEAFIAAYEGKLEESHKIYRRAFKGSTLEETPLDVEVFITDVLELEPDKIQLWYCLGMINYFYKKDLAAARHDFSRFVQAASQCGKFDASVQYARQFLAEINEKVENLTNGHEGKETANGSA